MKQMPWKNGGGMTSEIAISPSGAQVGQLDFDWRVSIASVDVEGPFSVFPGYDRVLAVWKGAGLVVDGVTRSTMQPFSFSGDKQIGAQLISGSVKDFGAIFKRGRVQAELKAHSLGVDEIHSVKFNGECFVLCARGELRIGEFYLNPGEVVYESNEGMSPESDRETGFQISGSETKRLEIKALEQAQFLILTVRLGDFSSIGAKPTE